MDEQKPAHVTQRHLTVRVISKDGWQNGNEWWPQYEVLELDCKPDRIAFYVERGVLEIIKSKKEKTNVEIQYVRWIQGERSKINSVPLGNINFFENGTKLDISAETISDYGLTGLSNIDFIMSGEYRKKGKE